MNPQVRGDEGQGRKPSPVAPAASGSNCCGAHQPAPHQSATAPLSPDAIEVSEYFHQVLDHSYAFAESARSDGKPIVGIMCEFTPRELILAAGALPVCLCGGSADTIPAAEQFLPSNLCPLIKSTFGYHVTGKNPFLQWADLLVAETTCDGKKKMFELMAASRPMYVLELPQKAERDSGLEQWLTEIRRFKDYLEHHFEVRLTQARLHEAVLWMNRERHFRRQLAELMQREVPPFTGRQLLDFRTILSGNPEDLRQLERAVAAFSHSPGPPANQGLAVPSARPVRVLLTGVPLVRGAERVVDLIESSGALVVCMENCTGLKPILEDVDLAAEDLVRAIAEKYYHLPCSVMTPNRRRFDSLRELTRLYRPDCVIELIWHACLTYDVESFQTRKLVEDDLGLPYLKITTDYSPGDSERIRARVDALFEMIRSG